MYAKGRGVLKDYKQAAAWYRKAAEQGDSGAQFNLGVMYALGEVVLKDLKLAKQFIQQAHDNGHDDAAEAWEEFELWKY